MRHSYFRSVVLALLVLTGRELRSSGSASTAVRLADINPGTNGSFPKLWTPFGGELFFSAYSLSTGRELWKTSNNTAVLVRDINDTADNVFGVIEGNDSVPEWLTPFAGALYFSAFEPRRGGELWRTDGTNTTRVSDINPDASDAIKPNPNSSWPNELVVLGSALYFSATSSTTPENYELWKYNGVAVSLVTNIHPSSGTNWSSFPKSLTAFNGSLYFMADDGANGFELWKHDGVSTVLLTNINPGANGSSSFPKGFIALSNQLYFAAYESATGYELWKTDGTNVTRVTDLIPGPESSYPEFLTTYNGSLYFRATDGLQGYELWKFDGSTSSIVTNLNAAGDAFPKNPMVFQGQLFFSADDGVHGWELWSFDGTNATLVADLDPGGNSFPEELTVVGDRLFFTATTSESGYEIWQYDGRAVALAADVNPGSGSSFPRELQEFNGRLYFSAAADGISDWEPWRLDPPLNLQISATIVRVGNNIELTWIGTSARTNFVQASTNILGPYQNVSSPLISTGSVAMTSFNFLDAGAITNQPVRFYRILVW